MWHKTINYLKQYWSGLSSRQKHLLVFVCLLTVFFPLMTSAALDKVTEALLQILTAIVSLLVSFFGALLAVVLHALIWVAQYNNFINESVVREGWKVVRDICNMFFVLGLLIIAFGTVLRLQNYQAKSNLKSFIFGAIFVNFSKTICGLILDFAQVIMLTFVNGFKDVGAGNLTEMLGITTLFDVVTNNANAAAVASTGIFVSYLLALVYLIVAFVVILTMTIMLIQRAVMLWLFIVLSPFPYLLSALPKSGKIGQIASRWWTDFTGLVITGPLLAFFIWLSFFTVSDTGFNKNENGNTQVAAPSQSSNFVTDINAGVTAGGTADAIIKFLVSIGILWGGMMLTKETSSLVGGVVGGGMGKLSQMGNFAKKTASRAAVGKVKDTTKWAGRNALKGGGTVIAGLAKNDNTKFGQAARKIGLAGKAWGEDLTENRQKQKTDKRLATLKKLGLGEKGMKAFKEVADDDLVKGVSKTVKGAGSVALGAVGLVTGNPLLMTAGLASVGIGVNKSPFGAPLGRSIKKKIGGSKAIAYEKANNDYHAKVNDAAKNMNHARSQAKKDFDSGIIDRSKYNTKEQEAIKEYKKTKKIAEEELIMNQKTIGNPKIAQEIKDLEQTKNSKISLANQKHNELLEPITIKRDRELAASKEAMEQAKKDNKRKFANNSISKDDFERLNLAADINLDNQQERINKEYDKAAKPLTTERDAKTQDANNEYEKNKKVLTDTLDLKNVTDPLTRLFAKLEGGGTISNLANAAVNYHPLQTTSDALNKGLKDSQTARDDVDSISSIIDAKVLADSLNQRMFSGGLRGLDSAQIKFYQSLVDGNKNSQTAINNLAQAVTKLDTTDKNSNDILNSLIKGVATFSKSNGDSTGRLKPLIDALNKQTNGGYDDFQPKAQKIKLREVDRSIIIGLGDGGLQIKSFAKQESIVNIIGVDFDKLNFFNNIVPKDNTSEIVGANIESKDIPQVATELIGLIDKELISSQQLAEQTNWVNLLNLAKKRLLNPTSLSNLSLRNTGVALNSFENYLTSLHEALHGFGLVDEQLVENVAKRMANIFCHIDDVAKVAQNIIDITSQQKTDQRHLTTDDIVKALKDVKPMSQAEQVIVKETNENY